MDPGGCSCLSGSEGHVKSQRGDEEEEIRVEQEMCRYHRGAELGIKVLEIKPKGVVVLGRRQTIVEALGFGDREMDDA